MALQNRSITLDSIQFMSAPTLFGQGHTVHRKVGVVTSRLFLKYSWESNCQHIVGGFFSPSLHVGMITDGRIHSPKSLTHHCPLVNPDLQYILFLFYSNGCIEESRSRLHGDTYCTPVHSTATEAAQAQRRNGFGHNSSPSSSSSAV